jgi:hypothetical protein
MLRKIIPRKFSVQFGHEQAYEIATQAAVAEVDQTYISSLIAQAIGGSLHVRRQF